MGSRTMLDMLDCEQNMSFEEFSLSLGTQTASAVHMPSLQDQFMSPSLSSLLSSHVPETGKDCFDFAGGTQNATKVEALNNARCSVSTENMQCGHICEQSGVPCTILNPTYLKAAQELLDEILHVQHALKQSVSEKYHNFRKLGLDEYKESDNRSNCGSGLSSGNAISSDPKDSIINSSKELPSDEQQDLVNRMTELLSMLDEVDSRYKKYYHQMQIVITSFERVAGFGAAKPYTALALQTISRQFRCAHDAINQQIRVTRQRLGEGDATSNSHREGLSQLRYIDQQLKQQRALQLVRKMHHSWRPQRGLPESSGSILRAWLFEHFLHPYPKDSEKIMLVRRTGLTRNQVANWFINARVRLWKPMIEMMYNEEIGDPGTDAKFSPEQAVKVEDEAWATENQEQELQVRVASATADLGFIRETNDPMSPSLLGVGFNGCMSRMELKNSVQADDNLDCEVMKLQGDQRPNIPDHINCSDEIIRLDQSDDGSLMSAAATVWWDAITRGS